MNYLAHLLLADDTDASRIGNLLGDFAKGSLESLEEKFPIEVVRGIAMHREVDRFTDSHPLFKEARNLLGAERRRFAGILIDVFFDHFLCRHWEKFSDDNLAEFCQLVYEALERHPEWLIGRLKLAVPWMKRENWLYNYRSEEGVALTLKRIAQRSKRVTPIAEGMIDFHQHQAELERIFLLYMPKLVTFAKGLRPS